MAKIFFPLGALLSLVFAIVDQNPWKLIITVMFVVISIQAYKASPSEQDDSNSV